MFVMNKYCALVGIIKRCLITFHHVLPLYSCCCCVGSSVIRPGSTPEIFHTQPCKSYQQLIILILPWAWAHDNRISLAIIELLSAVSLNAKLAQFFYKSLKCLGFWPFMIIHINTILLTFPGTNESWQVAFPCHTDHSKLSQAYFY
jgi:hypothetical protein